MDLILTLQDLKKTTHVFDNFTTIEDSDIPDYYREIFPKRCKCGAEMIMTRDRTQLQCCNPECWVKMAYRLSYFVSYHGFKGFGDQAALSLFSACHDLLPYPSFLSVFCLTDTELSQGLGDHQLALFTDIKETLANTPFHFRDAVASLGIPRLGKNSVLFDYVKNKNVLVSYVCGHKTAELCNMIGIQAANTRYHLSNSVTDLAVLLEIVMPYVIDTPKGEVYVAITGKVSVNGVGYNRSEFIALCESILDSNGSPLVKLVETKAQDKLQYVIADTPSNSDKYQLGQRLNLLITAEDFYNMLKAQADGVTSAEEKSATEAEEVEVDEDA